MLECIGFLNVMINLTPRNSNFKWSKCFFSFSLTYMQNARFSLRRNVRHRLHTWQIRVIQLVLESCLSSSLGRFTANLRQSGCYLNTNCQTFLRLYYCWASLSYYSYHMMRTSPSVTVVVVTAIYICSWSTAAVRLILLYYRIIRPRSDIRVI